MKPKLLVVVLWGMGDLVIASPFLEAASKRFQVTLLAKPYAQDLQVRLWPEVRVIPFVAPWTAFTGKYRLFSWPWKQILALRKKLAGEKFDFGLSARWDPRDHFLLALVRVKRRIGFPRLLSQVWLSQSLVRPDPQAHQYENWRVLAEGVGLQLPARENLVFTQIGSRQEVLVHTGAGQPVRVWPLERYAHLVARLRRKGYGVQVACDPEQRGWWLNAGESDVATPGTVAALLALIDRAGGFVGNDSGPGHLAGICGVPTFTIFGPQLPEWFAPLDPAAEWMDGKACPYKPCSDYCRFMVPCCMVNSGEEEVCAKVESFLQARFCPSTALPPLS